MICSSGIGKWRRRHWETSVLAVILEYHANATRVYRVKIQGLAFIFARGNGLVENIALKTQTFSLR
jgi:hypothetical protein